MFQFMRDMQSQINYRSEPVITVGSEHFVSVNSYYNNTMRVEVHDSYSISQRID